MQVFTFRLLKLTTDWLSGELNEKVAKICKKHGGFYQGRAGSIPAGYAWPASKQAEFDACVQELEAIDIS